MTGLKEYWDSLDNVTPAGIDTHDSLARVLVVIGRREKRRRASKLLVIAAVAAAIAVVPFLRFHVDNIPLLHCHAGIGTLQSITLPDGTSVTLNSGSSLVYPQSFSGSQRRVFLTGEAYFDVTQDKMSPFTVSAVDFEVEVLGTRFNIEAYSDRESSSVVLLEGSVKIHRGGQDLTLLPGQRAVIHGDGSLGIDSVRAEDFTLWRNGGIVFSGASMEEIAEVIKRTYGVKVMVSYSEKFDNTGITYRRESGQSLEELMSLLARLVPDMQYEIKDNTVHIY